MTGRIMRHTPPEHPLPDAPPPEALAELDAAAAALAALDEWGTRIALSADERAPRLRISLVDASGARELTPTQLFDLLA